MTSNGDANRATILWYDTEDFWRGHHPWLQREGLELRSRYRPHWTPSWWTSGKDNRDCDDGRPLSPLCNTMDATDIASRRTVVLKKLSTSLHANELAIIEYLNGQDLRAHPHNPCVHLQRTLDPPHTPHTKLLVMPLLRKYNDPTFQTPGGVLASLRQIFEGLHFMHEHGIAYRNPQEGMAIMMDPSLLFPDMYHPLQTSKSPDLKRRAKYKTRTPRPVGYSSTDFSHSRRYTPKVVREAEPPSPFTSSRRLPPEFSNNDLVLRDPFPTDVWYLGSMIESELLKKFNGLDFLRLLVNDMNEEGPSRRPTMAEVISRFESLSDPQSLSESKLRSRLVPKDGENIFTRISRTVKHALRTK